MTSVFCNRRPRRLPIYEHIITPVIMERILGTLCGLGWATAPTCEFFAHYNRFFHEMTYDTVSFEVCITEILPGHGAILGGRGRSSAARLRALSLGRAARALLGLRRPEVRRAGAAPAARHAGPRRRGQRRVRDQRGPGRASSAWPICTADDPSLFERALPQGRRVDGDHLATVPATACRRLCHLPLRRRSGFQEQHAGLAHCDPAAHHPAVPAGDRRRSTGPASRSCGIRAAASSR